MKHFKTIVHILLLLTLFTACHKSVPPTDVVGSWRAIHEDWTIVAGGKTTSASYDSAEAPSEDFAFMQLSRSLVLISGTSTSEKTFTMVYSDRFSPLEAGSAKHVTTNIAVYLRWERLKGSGDATWTIRSVNKEEMVVDYDSGAIGTGEAQQRRMCRFVFRKTGEKVAVE